MGTSIEKSNILCLLGMHRSGTSLLANWLYNCGLNLGDNLLKGDFSNKKGHFEDNDFLSFHKELLKENDLKSNGLFIENLNQITFSQYQLKKLEHLIKFKCDLHTQWGWKEPRTCLFIHKYLELFPEIKILIIHRPILDSIKSLLKRDGKRWEIELKKQSLTRRVAKTIFKKSLKKKFIDKNIDAYIKASLIYLRQLNKITIEYSNNVRVITIDQLISHDYEIFQFLTEKWNFNLTYKDINSIYSDSLIGQKLDINVKTSTSDLIDEENLLLNNVMKF